MRRAVVSTFTLLLRSPQLRRHDYLNYSTRLKLSRSCFYSHVPLPSTSTNTISRLLDTSCLPSQQRIGLVAYFSTTTNEKSSSTPIDETGTTGKKKRKRRTKIAAKLTEEEEAEEATKTDGGHAFFEKKAFAVRGQIYARALSDKYDVNAIRDDQRIAEHFQIENIDLEGDSEARSDYLRLVKRNGKLDDKSKENLSDVFIFADGMVVIWNNSETERFKLIRLLERHKKPGYNLGPTTPETDIMPYIVDKDGHSRIVRDRFVLNGSTEKRPTMLECFAFSHAFATSVKLDIWEKQMEYYAGPLASSTNILISGRMPWNDKESFRMLGIFAALRHSVNHGSTVLDTDIYWDRTELEHVYMSAIRYFDVKQRHKELNVTLDRCEDFAKLVGDMLNHRHNSRLEIMIILLIVIEVVFDILHYFSITPEMLMVWKEDNRKQEENDSDRLSQ